MYADIMKKKKLGKPRSHYCWVCGLHKPNEKFSGRGHANHMCKQCHALPVAERNEMVAVRKADNMTDRHLNEQEIKWLRKKMNDPRPAVRDAARGAHHTKFPRYERNQIKKGLTAFSLELFLRGEVWDEWGDEIDVHTLITLDRTGVIRCTDYTAPEGAQETEIVIDGKEARRFLKSVIHEYDALFWDEDLSDDPPGEFDPYLDLLPEYRPDFDEDELFADEDSEPEAEIKTREPLWSLCLELNNGGEKKIIFYNQLHDAPQELFQSLMEWFEFDDDEDDCPELEEEL